MPTDPPKFYTLDDTNGSGKFDRGDDLKPGIKKTLGDYLSELTKTSPTDNNYSIASDSVEHVSFTDDDGHPSPIVTGQGSGETVFIDQVAESAKAYFETLSNTGVFDTADPTAEGLIDIINKRTQQDGHTLLSSVEGTPLDTSGQTVTPGPPKNLIEEKTQGILLNNRFNPSGQSPYIQDGQFSESYGQKQGKFGEYDQNSTGYEIEDLTKVACSLLLKASGRLTSAEDPGEYDAGNILTVGEGAGGSLGVLSTVRVGTKKVGPGELYAANAYGGDKIATPGLVNAALAETAGPDGEKARADGFNVPGTSFGQIWSHLEQFAPTGQFSASPIALLIPQIAVITTLTAVIGLLTGLATPGLGFGKDVNEDPYRKDILQKGRYKAKYQNPAAAIPAALGEKLGIPKTKNSYITSVFTGLAFFQASAAFGGAGYVANAQRAVARDVVDFGSGIADKFSGGFVSDLLGLGSLIYDLASSKSFRFVQVMAVMGDKLLIQLNNKNQYFVSTLDGTSQPPQASLDDIEERAETRIMKSRSSAGDRKLTWRNNSSPSRYIYPAKLKIAIDNGYGGSDDGFANVQSKEEYREYRDYFVEVEKGRISSEAVQKIENELNSEYMPFYFHDLRTNEIISFHAFLTNLTDAYSPKWNSVDGIGRVEPVQIYESTDRKISIEFFVASTNKQDFDMMWYKINKLVTLVYPQWSRGRFVDQGDTKFIQPFSNVKTASPLVRIRLGDLLKSNYSKFALSRLFGLTEDGFTIENESFSLGIALAENERTELAGGETVFVPGDQVPVSAGREYKVSSVTDVGGKKNTSISKVYVGSVNGSGKQTSEPPIMGTIVKPTEIRTATIGGAQALASFKAALASNPATAGQIVPEPPDIDILYVNYVKIPGNSVRVYAEEVVIETTERMRISAADISEFITGSDSVDFQNKFNDWMNPDNNAIVRSFESTRGRGLAGAITGMDFTWQDMVWETSPGKRAPQMCKVSISFTPIHDIQPGIDHEGFNRAPIYNVGNVVNGFGFDPYDGSGTGEDGD